MGQKINPFGFRIGSYTTWQSRWFFDDPKKYREYLLEDIKIRRMLMNRLKVAGITGVEIERLPKSMTITLNVSRPGVVIGRGGSGIEDVKKMILSVIGKMDKNVKIDLPVVEVKIPELSAQLVAERIGQELERRVPQRRVVSRAMERVMQAGGLGIKVVLSGRIGGAEIARKEQYHMGSVPTQTLRENIDYVQVPALLKRGYVGVKVWIHKKEEQ
ncbi:30S ribosomal protein S3 [Candidatus Woesebacteria bacterium RIFCSPHIGHO2_01_FULL_39_28]|uniref:Small ribosomal subunit protein uS3 n=1 Tax=Candidatus Woesebacteria bacterium RIFCSPHIGHO2_01_FULL_39_28 TaxID=1802496 RepID=A0A1F7YA63_9BACT|nr:MAG: 30S ribosomal protein S3 [Candidatus Woesebacteria bacterium RIFCSPHIGHO2_01_FULL_39_28]OGM58469.1 MAG: 30S ribosomal protein S3 [Candidatus Woesebacteria bacterium RIFCSPLOWO2_01_FULL_38_20]